MDFKTIFLICCFFQLFLLFQEIQQKSEKPQKSLWTFNSDIINKFDFKIGLGLFLNFLVNISTNYIGITGSGLIFSILIFCFDFETKKAIPIYKMANLMAAVINIIYVFNKRTKENQNKLYLDWNLAGFCISLLFSGSMIGILVSNFFPSFDLLLMITLILIWITILQVCNFFRSSSQNQQLETVEQQKLIQNEETILDDIKDTERISLWKIFYLHKKHLMIIIISLLAVIIGSLSKGSDKMPSFFFERCSSISFIIFFICLLIPIFFGYKISSKITKKFSTKKVRKIGFFSVFAGMITSFGLSGSLVFASGLVILNLNQMVLTSLTRVMVFMTSFSAALQFFLQGYLDVADALIIGTTSVLGSFLGIYAFNYFQQKRNDKILNIILICILVISIILMPFIIKYEIEHNPEAHKFGGICQQIIQLFKKVFYFFQM